MTWTLALLVALPSPPAASGTTRRAEQWRAGPPPPLAPLAPVTATVGEYRLPIDTAATDGRGCALAEPAFD